MKRLIALLVLCVMLCSVTAFANDLITVKVNGEIIESPVPAKIINDRTVLPMRAIFEKLGATVTWLGEDSIIFAVKGDIVIIMQIGNNKMSVRNTEENKTVELDVAPLIENDSTLVPVRAVAEALKAKVDWDGDTRTVEVNL